MYGNVNVRYHLHVCTVHQQYKGTFSLFQTDAHNYKIIGIFKQLKFRLSLRHVSVHAGTIKCVVRVQHTCTTGWYAAMTLNTSVTTST